MKRLSVLLFLLALAGPARAAHVLVGPGETYTTIRSGMIAAVTSGDSVLVRSGNYTDDGPLYSSWKSTNIYVGPYGDGDVTVTMTGTGVYAIEFPTSNRDGGKVNGLNFINTGDATNQGIIIHSGTTYSYAVTNCTFANFPVFISSDADHNDITISGNSFVTDTMPTYWSGSNYTLYDWIITGNTFDYSAAQATTGNHKYLFRWLGAHGMNFSDNVFYAPVVNNGLYTHCLQFENFSGTKSIGCTIEGNTFIMQDPISGAPGGIYLGGTGLDSVDSMTVRFNKIYGSTAASMGYGIESEAAADTVNMAEANVLAFNFVSNMHGGVFFAETNYKGRIEGNYCIGIDGAAYNLQDSRECSLIGNVAINCTNFLNMGSGNAREGGVGKYYPYANRIERNYAKGISGYYYSISADCDSASTYLCNIGESVNAWAYIDDGTGAVSTLADFQAWTPVTANEWGYVPGFGSVQMGVDATDDASLRRVMAIPGAGVSLTTGPGLH